MTSEGASEEASEGESEGDRKRFSYSTFGEASDVPLVPFYCFSCSEHKKTWVSLILSKTTL